MPSVPILQAAIAPARQRITTHPVYSRIQSLEDLRQFSAIHVFAVWDFMSLLKSLQQELTCTRIPWVPVGSASTRYLINEIVTGEESDVDLLGNRCSHFELYLQAMEQLGADTSVIHQLIKKIKQGTTIEEALATAGLPAAVHDFCAFTFDCIANEPVHVQAAVFTFGREDLIPDMFHEMVNGLSAKHPEHTTIFRYYLERHIEVDGDHHSQLALQMVNELCGTDKQKWEAATEASIRALELRAGLWDAVLEKITDNEMVAV